MPHRDPQRSLIAEHQRWNGKSECQDCCTHAQFGHADFPWILRLCIVAPHAGRNLWGEGDRDLAIAAILLPMACHCSKPAAATSALTRLVNQQRGAAARPRQKSGQATTQSWGIPALTSAHP